MLESAKLGKCGFKSHHRLQLRCNMEKMSKSDSKEKNDLNIMQETRIESLKSQVNYWKTRYELLKKYGNLFNM
jgi:hypothetical protein